MTDQDQQQQQPPPNATDAPEEVPQAPAPAPQPQKKTRKKRKPASLQNPILAQFSIRKPEWAYIHLQHLSSNNPSSASGDLDGVTAHLHLTAALSAFLGLHGSAIPLDILRLEGRDVWIRAPAEDRAAVLGAAGGWRSASGEGWRVRGWSHWDAGAAGRDAGQELFEQ